MIIGTREVQVFKASRGGSRSGSGGCRGVRGISHRGMVSVQDSGVRTSLDGMIDIPGDFSESRISLCRSSTLSMVFVFQGGKMRICQKLPRKHSKEYRGFSSVFHEISEAFAGFLNVYLCLAGSWK